MTENPRNKKNDTLLLGVIFGAIGFFVLIVPFLFSIEFISEDLIYSIVIILLIGGLLVLLIGLSNSKKFVKALPELFGGFLVFAGILAVILLFFNS